MKKVLLLLIMAISGYHVFAFTTQGVWRWRKDDGSETTATWRAAQNTPITIASADSTLRLRIELYNNGSGGLLDGAFFEDSSNEPGSHWDTIRLTAGNSAFILAGTSPNVTDQQATTHQLSGQSTGYTFDPGQIIVSSESLPAHTVPKAKTSEYEYVFKPSANIKPNVTYYFRVDAANYLVGYAFPSLTTAGVLPVTLVSFKAEAKENTAVITWTTATETDNTRFDVERSGDGRTYTTLTSVKGNGTTSQSHSYQVTDSKPMNGTNYYRIRQYDNNGKSETSAIRSLQFALQKVVANAYPNPTPGAINFALNNYQGASVAATVIDVSGKMVHAEKIGTSTTGNYKLNLPGKLPAGIYTLKLEGTNLSEKIKIVVQ